MKILNIYFKNINSLEGESKIHFDRAPIVDGGVFAITGPNGSGKSSVLDVITLGLYGETFRFDRPAAHVMTKASAECFAQVEFLLGGEKYRSTWHAKRKGKKSKGELLEPEMKLIHLNGSEQLIEESAIKVRDKMAELTGMDFHKFTKSMVLAQGDFAAFLNALDSERMDILEKISGTDIYDNFKKQVEQQFEQEESQLQLLKRDLSAIPMLDDAAIEANEHDLADFSEQQNELQNEHQQIEKKLRQVQKVVGLEQSLEKLDAQIEQEQNKLEENQQALEKIGLSQTALVFEEQIVSIDKKTEQVQQSKKTLDSYRSELNSLQKKLESSEVKEAPIGSEKTIAKQKQISEDLKLKLSELKVNLPKETSLLQTLEQQLSEKKSSFEQTEIWLNAHQGDKQLLANLPAIEKLKQLRIQLTDQEKQSASFKKGGADATDEIKKKKDKITELNKKNDNLKRQIEETKVSLEEMANGNSLEELQELKVEQQERVDNFQELCDLAGVNAKLGKKSIFSLSFWAEGPDKEEEQLEQESDKLQLEIGKQQQLINTLESAVSNEKLLQKMQVDRQYLVDGKACPLCGALDHPYATHSPAVSNSKQMLTEQKKNAKSLQAEFDSVSKQINALKVQAKKDSEKDEQLQIVCSQWNNLANRLNMASEELDIDDLSVMKASLKSEKTELLNINKLIKNYLKQQSSDAKYHAAIETNAVISKRLSSEIEALETKKDNLPQETIEQNKLLEKYRAEEKELSAQVAEQLQVLSEPLPEIGQEDILINSLSSRREEYQSRLILHETLIKEIKEMDEKVVSVRAKLEVLNQELQQFSEQEQQQKIAGLHLSLVEKQKLIADKEKQFSQLESEVEALNKNLLEQTKETANGDIGSIKDAIALAKKQPQLQQELQSVKQKIKDIKNKKDQVQSDLEVQKAQLAINESEEELLAQQKSLKQKIDIAKQETTFIKNKLVKQTDLKEKHQVVSEKIASQQAVVEACQAEINMINDENGLQFRRKVQQNMSDKLLSQTNQILEKISGRYYVRKAESEHGLALEVEDTKQQNVRRLPKTLSGGESFVVSLSLALGLAEMAHNGHAVDSLFLDEGFGNLDAESLYLAMTTLESLKTHGKVVGVISHVEGVRKRIKTQVEMIKKPNGLSALKVIS